MKKGLVQKMIQKYGERVKFFRLTDDDFYRLNDMSDYEKDEELRWRPNSKLSEYIIQEREDKKKEESEDAEAWELYAGDYSPEAEKKRIEKFLEDLCSGRYKPDWDD